MLLEDDDDMNAFVARILSCFASLLIGCVAATTWLVVS